MCFIFYFKTVRKRYTATGLRQATAHFRCVAEYILILDWDSYRDARAVNLFFFVRNLGQFSAFKAAYILKLFGAQRCFMVT